MLYSLRGKLIHAEPRVAVIECGGVGFRCQITMTTARALPALGAEATLYTIMNVREDAIELFGFAEQAELECFKQLTSVTGVGPKAGLAILSELSPERVALAAASGDYKALTRAQGVGPKLAQRIVLELKDKVEQQDVSVPVGTGAPAAPVVGDAQREAQAALQALGYTSAEAARAINLVRDQADTVDALIMLALRQIGSL